MAPPRPAASALTAVQLTPIWLEDGRDVDNPVTFAGVARQSVEVAVVVPALENDELFVTTLNQYDVPAVRVRVVEVPDVVVNKFVGFDVVPQ